MYLTIWTRPLATFRLFSTAPNATVRPARRSADRNGGGGRGHRAKVLAWRIGGEPNVSVHRRRHTVKRRSSLRGRRHGPVERASRRRLWGSSSGTPRPRSTPPAPWRPLP